MTRLVLLRHGESIWNKSNRFTGWTDVDLSEGGVLESVEAGQGTIKLIVSDHKALKRKTLARIIKASELIP